MQEMDYFYLLKDQLLRKYREFYPHWDKSLHEFKGREIANFQMQLQKEINGRISEKWFYTHLKPLENKKLPRIDILDMLSQFVGHENWEYFMRDHAQAISTISPLTAQKNKALSKLIPLAILALVSLVAFFVWHQLSKSPQYRFCFINADTKYPIREGNLRVKVLNPSESPIYYQANAKGYFELETKKEQVQFIVFADYYHTDTISRRLNPKMLIENIPLQRDDYALMIHLFSKSKLADWNKQRQQLAKIIADEALIFQVATDGNTGMEMYNKEEFIDKMSLPLHSLKNIDILNTQYQDGKIIRLRFIQKLKK